MTAKPAADEIRLSRVLLLLALSVFINYLDRGPAFGTLAGGILMSRFGWRPVFLVVGLTSLLWLPPWFRWMPRRHEDSPSQSGLFVPGMLGSLSWTFIVGAIRQVDWSTRPAYADSR
jgi:MFS family permease